MQGGQIYRLQRNDKREVPSSVDEIEHLVVLSCYSFYPLGGRIDDAATASQHSDRIIRRTKTNWSRSRALVELVFPSPIINNPSTFSTAPSTSSKRLRTAFPSLTPFLTCNTLSISSRISSRVSLTRRTSFLMERTGFRMVASEFETAACRNPSDNPMNDSYSSLMTATSDVRRVARYARSYHTAHGVSIAFRSTPG